MPPAQAAQASQRDPRVEKLRSPKRETELGHARQERLIREVPLEIGAV